MFGKKGKNTLDLDADRVDVACSEIESLKMMIEEAKERIISAEQDMADRVNFYSRQVKRLREAKDFCEKLLSASNP